MSAATIDLARRTGPAARGLGTSTRSMDHVVRHPADTRRRSAVASPATRQAPAPVRAPRHPGRQRPAVGAPAAVASCALVRPAMVAASPGRRVVAEGDRALAVLVFGIIALFAVALVVLVQGFWTISSGAGEDATGVSTPVVVAER